jgi:peptidoglycan/LPS O-acetylase OafA/YrhL
VTPRPRHARAAGPAEEGRQVPYAVTGRHLPALDGLRAVAVAGVIAYHLGSSWASGGYLGVDLFFVLSGFLITSLLLEEWSGTGRLALGAFWGRRARRLLPALFLLLVAIGAYVVLNGRFGPPGSAAQIDLSGLRGDALATLLYVANWHAIFAHQSYFAQFSAPSPLQHTWSLAIEEQFYLVWPLLLLGLLTWSRRHWRRVGLGVTVAGALGSAALMAALYHPGGNPTRIYLGTDTRAFDLLAGAAVAMLVAARPQPRPAVRRLLHAAALPAAAALGVCWVVAGTATGLPRSWMFEGGFLGCAGLAAVVVADARLVERGPLGAVLSLRPLRWLGTISYGVYLWHWPVIVYLSTSRTGLVGWRLDLARLAVTLAAATASFYLVERPLRRRQYRGWARRSLAPLGALATAAVVVVSTVPAVAAPTSRAPVVTAAPIDTGASVAGAGGFGGQRPIVLPPGTVSPAHPLRVTLVGDSVMYVAEPGIAAALGATGEVVVSNNSIPGFGLSTATVWPTEFPAMLRQQRPELVLATWSWDDDWALARPAQYTATLERAVRTLLDPGGGVRGADGVIFLQFPPSGPVVPYGTQLTASDRRQDAQRAAGQRAWNRIVESLPKVFPGRVMYLPVASSILLDGHYSPWLPPQGDPSAPRSSWTRVRMVDNVHLCPAGVVRYADAVLADLTMLFRLSPARAGWWNGSWQSDSRYNTPPGACPDDHPPG